MENEVVFDVEEAWDRLIEAWTAKYPGVRTPTRDSYHRQVFTELVSSNVQCDDVISAIEARDPRKSPERLDQIIRQVKEFERVSVAQITRVDLNDKYDRIAEDATAREIAAFWPRNAGASETEQIRLQVLRRAFAQYDHEEVLKGCRFYCQQFWARQAGDFPYTLANFIERNDGHLLKFWTTNAKYQPDEHEKHAFDSAWEWYPDFEEKEAARAQSFILYRQWIQTDDARLQFQCAVQHYRDLRSDKDKKYVKSFRKFLRTWDLDDEDERSARISYTANQVIKVVRDWSFDQKVYWPEWSDGGAGGLWGPMCKDKNLTVRQALEHFWTEWLKRSVEPTLLDGFMEQAWKWVTRPLPR